MATKATSADVERRKPFNLNAASTAQRNILWQLTGIANDPSKQSALARNIETAVNHYWQTRPERTTAKKIGDWLLSTHKQAKKLEQELKRIHPTAQLLLATEGYLGITASQNIHLLQNGLKQYLEASDRCLQLTNGWSAIGRRTRNNTNKLSPTEDPFRRELLESLSTSFREYAEDDHLGQNAFKRFASVIMTMAGIDFPSQENRKRDFNRLFKNIDMSAMPPRSRARLPK